VSERVLFRRISKPADDNALKGLYMKSRSHLLIGLVTFALAFGATDTFAQFGSRGGSGGMMGGSRGGGNRDQSGQDNRRNSPVQQAVDSYEQTEYRLQLMEEDLHLQPAQRPVWDSFATKVRAYASDLARARARARTPPAEGGVASGVQFIEQTADTARNQATALDDIAIAAKSLYDKLAPTQKVLADARIVTLVAPQSRAGPAQDNLSNLPDLGSSGRLQR
jgi:hypothetical protein